MRISDLAVVILMGACAASAAHAQDAGLRGPQADAAARAILAPLPGAAAKPVPLAPFASARDALRAGVRSYNAGNKAGAAEALEFAAGQGHALALWKLGRMYSAGDGVPHDDLKAFEYYSRIADEFADETPGTQNARIVASAFVALGGYFRDGIKGSYVAQNPSRAFEMFQYAASYYGDPEAQYHLSRLYLEGFGTRKDARQAARWVHLSADKGHVEAQALLGQLMLAGSGVPRQPSLGLMWLTLARDGADPERHGEIIAAHEAAVAAASQAERDHAMVLLQRHLDRGR
jgi:hypothetical protein